MRQRIITADHSKSRYYGMPHHGKKPRQAALSFLTSKQLTVKSSETQKPSPFSSVNDPSSLIKLNFCKIEKLDSKWVI